MSAPMHDAYVPLNTRHTLEFAPAQPGSFSLAIQLANGTFHAFYSAETHDLREEFLRICGGEHHSLPPHIGEYLDRFQCYVRYMVFDGAAPAYAVEKMLGQCNDPIAVLRIHTCN